MPTSKAKNPKSFAQSLKYTGELAQPIYEPKSIGVAGRAREAEMSASIRQARKLGRLMHWYRIDPDSEDSWYSLALALAIEHVPGLRVIYAIRPKHGRKRSWKAGLGDELIRDVDTLQKKLKIKMSAACLLLSKDDKWRQYSEQNLVTRHREARRAARQRKLRSPKRA